MDAVVLLAAKFMLTRFIFGVGMNKHCQDITNTGINKTFKSLIMPIKVWLYKVLNFG